MRHRVVVTGIGMVSPVGRDVASTWSALLAGRSGITLITQFDTTGMDVRIAGEVKDFDPEALFDRRVARRNDRFALFVLEAARQAVEDGRLVPERDIEESTGAIIGTSIGGVLTMLSNYDVLKETGPRRVSALLAPMMMPNAAAAAVAIAYGLQGPTFCVASACASGGHAIGEAAAMIRRGDADLMFCGGSDAALGPLSISAFANMGALSTRNDDPERASRPFDAERDGFVSAEGAGVLILERLEHALRRDAHIYAELVGYGSTSDAFHITAPDEDGAGASRAMRLALEDGGITTMEVGYINAHGTGTPLNDRTETRAIRAVFGEHADRIPVSSTKSMIGHTLGAAGAIEAIVTIKALETGWVHPTINHECADPECDLDYVPDVARQAKPDIAMSNSFGFGGHNVCLVFQRWTDDAA
ncbi:MAG: beta-ketoacyl-ACP synthase II [Chloroflexi bacterium]|nr:beta-ketoacyl-ACP synthase II [Chloroflexota bacterium]